MTIVTRYFVHPISTNVIVSQVNALKKANLTNATNTSATRAHLIATGTRVTKPVIRRVSRLTKMPSVVMDVWTGKSVIQKCVHPISLSAIVRLTSAMRSTAQRRLVKVIARKTCAVTLLEMW